MMILADAILNVHEYLELYQAAVNNIKKKFLRVRGSHDPLPLLGSATVT